MQAPLSDWTGYRINLQKLKAPEVFPSDLCKKERGEKKQKLMFAKRRVEKKKKAHVAEIGGINAEFINPSYLSWWRLERLYSFLFSSFFK